MVSNIKRLLSKIPLGVQVTLLGILAFIMNWKTWAFYLLCIGVFLLLIIDRDILTAIYGVLILYGLKWCGKLF